MSIENAKSQMNSLESKIANALQQSDPNALKGIKFNTDPNKTESDNDPNQTENNDNPNKTGTSETKTEEQEKREISEEEANAIVGKANQFDMKLSPENIIRQDES